MKRVLFILISILLLIPSANYANYDTTLNRVVDNAGLLSDYEEDELELMIQNIIDEYNFDVVIVTTDTNEGKSVVDFADDFYDYNWYGIGENYDGILFLLSMEERDWYISTHGYGITVFTDYGISRMGDLILSYLSDGDYYEAFTQFLYNVEDYITVALEGNPYDSYYSDYDYDYNYRYDLNYYIYEYGKTILVIFFVCAIVALLIVLGMKSKMNTVRFRQHAHDYIATDSLAILKQSDLFLYSRTSKTRRETSSSSSGKGGGGSSTHKSSSGRTHGGGGGKF